MTSQTKAETTIQLTAEDLLAPAQPSAETTIQLTAEDLQSVAPPASMDSTIQLGPADLEPLEAAAAAEVIIRPSELRPSLPFRMLARLDWSVRRSGSALRRAALVSVDGTRRAAVASWSGTRRGAVAFRRGARPTLLAAGRGARGAWTRLGMLCLAAWASLRRAGQTISDSCFALLDWAGLKLRRITPAARTARVRVREARPQDRQVVEVLQRALAAYCEGDEKGGKLLVAEVEGGVAILVPGREGEVGELRTEGEPTALGRPLMTSTR